MKLNFFDPKGTPNSTQSLLKIYGEVSNKYNVNCTLTTLPLRDHVNITYGYLGYYSNNVFHSASLSQSFVCSNTFILDHAYMPQKYKGQVFRMARADPMLTSIIFNNKFLSSSHVDALYSHLKMIAERKDIMLNLSYPTNMASTTPPFNLLIKRSNILSKLCPLIMQSNLTEHWLSDIRFLRKTLLIAVKQVELSFTPSGKILGRKYNCSNVTIPYSDIDQVCCPTSMMIIPFILHSKCVYLSSSHPLYSLLGSYVPSLPESDAIDLILSCILKTSFSLCSMRHLESYLSRLCI